jgi:hypothetical protein
MIRKYCKAYYLKDLRQFPVWTEKREENESELTDEDVVYLWDDFVVVRSPVLPGGVIFDEVTPQWQEFCQIALHFEIPEDLRYAYERAEEESGSTREDSGSANLGQDHPSLSHHPEENKEDPSA